MEVCVFYCKGGGTMGYRIVYEDELQSRAEESQSLHKTQWMVAAFLLVFLIGVSMVWEQGRQRLRKLLLYEDSVTAAAVTHLSEGLRQGQPAVDAIAAFCREVVYGEEN